MRNGVSEQASTLRICEKMGSTMDLGFEDELSVILRMVLG